MTLVIGVGIGIIALTGAFWMAMRSPLHLVVYLLTLSGQVYRVEVSQEAISVRMVCPKLGIMHNERVVLKVAPDITVRNHTLWGGRFLEGIELVSWDNDSTIASNVIALSKDPQPLMDIAASMDFGKLKDRGESQAYALLQGLYDREGRVLWERMRDLPEGCLLSVQESIRASETHATDIMPIAG